MSPWSAVTNSPTRVTGGPGRPPAGSESDHDRSSERSDDLSSRESLAEQVNISLRLYLTEGVTCRTLSAISVIRSLVMTI